MPARRAYRVAYDGRPFYGFQRQPDVATVEGALLVALRRLGVLDRDAGPTAVPPGYAAAGRTDRGVSAARQTVAFDAPEWLTPRAFSSELPGGVRVWAHADVDAGFHATHDAGRRTYRYHLRAPGADLARAREAAARLSGDGDLHNLTTDERGPGTRRDVAVSVEAAEGPAADEFLVLSVSAGGFPREAVRRIATVVRGVATGRTGLDRVAEVLSDEHLGGPRGVAAAPPEPLALVDVAYPGVEFRPDPRAVATLREVFAERRGEALARARVAGELLDAADG